MSLQTKKTFTRTDRLVLIGLLVLSAVPAIGGSLRLTELSTGIEIIGDNERFLADPVPVVSHIIAAILFSVLGAFQFLSSFRRRFPKWHQRSGRLLMPAGLVVAVSGLWMSHFYPWPELDGEILYIMRLFFGTEMLLSIFASINAIRMRDFVQHGAWMIRAYAIAMAAGTQVFTHLPVMIFPDLLNESTRALCMGAGWVINLLVAEWVIRRKMSERNRSRSKTYPSNTTTPRY